MEKYERYDNLSFWREIACLKVFGSHLCARMELQGSIRVVTDFGYYGVLFFFIITGYLACDSQIIYTSKMQYWKKRAIRILPMYFTVMFFFLIAYSISENGIINGWRVLTSSNNIGGTWKVYVFILFYLLAPWLVKMTDSCYKAWICFIFFYGLRFIMNTYALGGGIWQSAAFLCFCIEGILIWHSFRNHENMLIFIVTGITLILLIEGATDKYFLYSLLFMLLFVSSRNLRVKTNKLRHVIDYLDKYSYEIYMMQGIMLYLFIDRRNLGKLQILLLSLVGVAVLSLVAYHGIEVPIRHVFIRQNRE